MQKITQQAAEINAFRSEIMNRLYSIEGADEQKFDFTLSMLDSEMSPNDADAHAIAILGLIEKTPVESGDILIPRTYLDGIDSNLHDVARCYENIESALQNISTHGSVGNVNAERLTLTSQNGKQTEDFLDYFNQLIQNLETLTINYHTLANILRGESYGQVSAAFDEFVKQMGEIQEARNKLAKAQKQTEKANTAVADLEKDTSASYEEVSRLKTASEKDRQTLSEYFNEGTQKITGIREISEEAGQLKVAVENYRGDFDEFQALVDKRKQAINDGIARQEELIKSLEEKEEEIRALNERAENMLSGATVAGLASSYGNMRDKLSGQVARAQWFFYASVAFFMASAGLAFDPVSALSGFFNLDINRATEASTMGFFNNLFSRALLILPAFFCVRFTSKRHAMLFRLKEHYEYKYSLAASVNEFKKQAVEYEQQIAAATFEALTVNPADGMEAAQNSVRRQNRILDAVLKKIDPTRNDEGDNADVI